jgi:hypothetical protein
VDHNFFSSGYQAVIRRFIVDHGSFFAGRLVVIRILMGHCLIL